ncbi:hypothetical protein [Fictibacillus terranigra]|uniref:Uncharacterized protein n=1 Tax=Fictibacillus terranigra TaxID=3058424 RepID=A0ABT8E6U5_9BACL|nr:hypothetical protein [Fictibacillus sp. CENA-BCM004]MDN4073627.1 hypothetical protein [Fictibacillus sp. CENA-BCM004]
MRKCVITQKVKVARCMVYLAVIKIVDCETGEVKKEIEKEYPKRSRGFVRDASLELALEAARELGYDHVQEIESTEGEIYKELL